MDGTEDYHVRQSKPGSERQRSHVFSHMWKLDLKNKCIYKCVYDLTHTCVKKIYIYLEREHCKTMGRWEKKRE
jgi:hypothetical protein